MTDSGDTRGGDWRASQVPWSKGRRVRTLQKLDYGDEREKKEETNKIR